MPLSFAHTIAIVLILVITAGSAGIDPTCVDRPDRPPPVAEAIYRLYIEVATSVVYASIPRRWRDNIGP